MITNTILFLTLLVIGNSNNYYLFKHVEDTIDDKESISETLKWIAHGLTHYVFMYDGYVINECNYHIKDHDDLRVT